MPLRLLGQRVSCKTHHSSQGHYYKWLCDGEVGKKKEKNIFFILFWRWESTKMEGGHGKSEKWVRLGKYDIYIYIWVCALCSVCVRKAWDYLPFERQGNWDLKRMRLVLKWNMRIIPRMSSFLYALTTAPCEGRSYL